MIDWTKPIQTEDGLGARVLCTDLPGDFPVVVAYEVAGSAFWKVVQFNEAGTELRWSVVNGPPRRRPKDRGCIDIVNVPQTHTVWVNCYKDKNGEVQIGHAHSERESADIYDDNHRIACIRVEFTEGEGL